MSLTKKIMTGAVGFSLFFNLMCGRVEDGTKDYGFSRWREISECDKDTQENIDVMIRALNNYSDKIVEKIDELVPKEKQPLEPIKIIENLSDVAISCGTPVERYEFPAVWMLYFDEIVLSKPKIKSFVQTFKKHKRYVDEDFNLNYDVVLEETKRKGYDAVYKDVEELFMYGTILAGLLLHESTHSIFYKSRLDYNHIKPSEDLTAEDIANDVICQYGYGFRAFWDMFRNEISLELEKMRNN